MSLILPGDTLPINADTTLTLGPGVYQDPQTSDVIPTSAGLLNTKINSKQTNTLYYIDSNSRRYIPQVNDFVIGIITGVFGEFYKVQLQNFSQTVILSIMAFPNATKKNRPNLKAGQIVYARVSSAVAEIDIEIECVDATTGKEGGFGLLEDGYLFDVNLNYSRELLFNANSQILEKLASRCKFEIAIGINGKIWLKSEDVRSTLAASTFLTNCQYIKKEELDKELNKVFKDI